MVRIDLHGLAVAALVTLSICNAGAALHRYFHWPIGLEDDWTRLERDLKHAKAIVNALPDPHLEYRTEEASNTYGPDRYFRLQYILAPSILQRGPSAGGYVLVEFWTTKKVMPLTGLILVEDLGHGFGLYRRP